MTEIQTDKKIKDRGENLLLYITGEYMENNGPKVNRRVFSIW